MLMLVVSRRDHPSSAPIWRRTSSVKRFRPSVPSLQFMGVETWRAGGRGIMAGYVKLHPASRVSPCAHTPYSNTLTPFSIVRLAKMKMTRLHLVPIPYCHFFP